MLAVVGRVLHPDYPDVPMIKEIYPDIDTVGWFGMFAPAGTPPAIIKRLSDEMAKIAMTHELNAQFLSLALRPNGSGPDELAAILRKDFDRYGKLVRELNLRQD